jgi:hypothetical protein
VVGAEHTIFEWCLIYTDQNPTTALGDGSGLATALIRDRRLILLGARGSNEPMMRPHPTETDQGVWDDPVDYRVSNAVYQELAESVMTRKIDAVRRYLDDRPEEIDRTLCIIGAAPVLAIARQRKDYGRYIAALLAQTPEESQATKPASKPTPLPPIHGAVSDEGLDGAPSEGVRSPVSEETSTNGRGLLWGKDLTKLPNRDELLPVARAKFLKVKVTQQDIRGLRRRLAPKEITRGGGKIIAARSW